MGVPKYGKASAVVVFLEFQQRSAESLSKSSCLRSTTQSDTWERAVLTEPSSRVCPPMDGQSKAWTFLPHAPGLGSSWENLEMH